MNKKINVLIVCVIIITGVLSGCGKNNKDDAIKKVEDTYDITLNDDEKQAVLDVKDALDEEAKNNKNRTKSGKVTLGNSELEKSVISTIWSDQWRRVEEGNLYQSDLDSIKELSIQESIKSIDNIDKLENLKRLNIYTNTLKSIEPLKNCKNLEYLDIRADNISDLSAINKLPKLNSLHLINMPINTLESIGNLPSLETLDLYNLNITNLNGIENIKSLKKIYVSRKVNDIRALSKLTNLEEITLINTKVSDLTPIQNLPKLKKLHIEGSNIVNIEPLKNLTSLSELKISTKMDSDEALNELKKALPNCKINY